MPHASRKHGTREIFGLKKNTRIDLLSNHLQRRIKLFQTGVDLLNQITFQLCVSESNTVKQLGDFEYGRTDQARLRMRSKQSDSK